MGLNSSVTGNEAREHLEKYMSYIRPLAFATAVCATFGLSSLSGASAATILAPALSGTANAIGTSAAPSGVIKVQKTPGIRDTGPYANKRNKRRNKRHRRNKRRYYNPGVFVDGGYYGYGGYYDDPYYDPYYDDPYYDDPYYSAPSYRPSRYTCGQIRNMLRRQGYRRIRAHDCTGKVYTFIAYAGHKRYKLRIRSKNASIKTRKRI